MIILIARSNDIADLLPLGPRLSAAVDGAESGSVVRLSQDADEPSAPAL
jgi:hypothetical protein